MAPDQQHQTKNAPPALRRAIGAREQAKAAALIGALAPSAGTRGATRPDTSALTGDAVDPVLLGASSPVLELGDKREGTVGTVVTPTADTALVQGTGGFVSGSGGGGLTTSGGGLTSTGGGVTGTLGGVTGPVTGKVGAVTDTGGGLLRH